MNRVLASKEIREVVVDFYRKAVDDIIIGYHFHHIEDFSTHIPRIVSFWERQLLGTSAPHTPFHFIAAHLPLKIKKGEVGRWMLLFEKTLEAHPLREVSKEKWRQKLQHFRQVFLKHPNLTKS